MPGSHTLSLAEFCALIAEELQLDPALVTPEATFVEDLLVDSIRMVDLLLRLEEMGVAFPMEALWDVQTVDDAYRVYAQSARGAGGARVEAGAG